MEDKSNYYQGLKKEMEECVDNGDTEAAHSDADDILCRLLHHLGYDEILDLYDEVNKWYA